MKLTAENTKSLKRWLQKINKSKLILETMISMGTYDTGVLSFQPIYETISV